MKIGKFNLEKPLALAPMEEVSDTPFRLICKRLGADILYTEFTSSEALIRDARKALDKILVTDEERPVGIQIYGGREEAVQAATKVAASAHPDFVDINCGCSVPNHVSRGEGAGLLRDLKKLAKIIQCAVRATELPVTIKTRLGWDAENVVILDVAKIAQDCGAQAITIHCRTRHQGLKGKADWSWLEKVKRAVLIPVIGNGDIKTPQDVKKMFETGCDAVMMGRGAFTNPWIFRQAKHFLKTGELQEEPAMQERVQVCIEHLKLSLQFKGQRYGIIEFRKHYSGYFHGLPYISKLRNELVQMTDPQKIIERLNEFAALPPCPQEVLSKTGKE